MPTPIFTASQLPHRTWAEIDLDAVRHNLAAARAQLDPEVRVMAVVKANAYGHGAVPVARALADRVEMFGVANVTEARHLQDSGITLPIFILGPALPAERAEIVRCGFIPAVSSYEEAAAYDALAAKGRFPVHLTLDTGMGRIGVWKDEALRVFTAIRELPNLEIAGLASHLPVADEDDVFTREQLASFSTLATALRGRDGAVITHIHNSAGVLGYPAAAGDLVRTGLMLYGSSPLPQFQPQLRPALTWKTRVTLVRNVGPGRGISYGRTFITQQPMRTATLAVGYADGYQRHLSGRGAEVLIRGRRCAVLGRVTMDQVVVDVSEAPGVAEGEEAVLIGRLGGEEILAAELAAKAGTIAWEIFTGIGHRVERVYRGGAQ